MEDKYLDEVKLLVKWYDKKISDDEFLEKFKLKKIRYRREVPDIAKEKLKEACVSKNSDTIVPYLSLIFYLKIDFDEIKDCIEEIITGNWHYDHENIAGAFEDIASPKTIEWVYYLALAHQFEGYEGGIAMARKCIHALGKINTPKSHALGKINTPKSKEKLELLANNLNETEELRESAKRELNRHDFTNKDVE